MQVFIELLTGLILTFGYGGGGTPTNPVPRYSENGVVLLASFDLPNGAGIVLINPNVSLNEDPNKVFHFKRILTTPNVIPSTGASMSGGQLVYVDDQIGHLRSSIAHPWTNQVLTGGELLPIYSTAISKGVPSTARRNLVLSFLFGITNLGEVASEPRIAHFLSLLEDAGAPASAPQGAAWDEGWLLRNWSITTGGNPLQGWYRAISTRGGDGLDNWHYNRLLYLALNYMENPSPARWEFGLRQAIAHASWGRHWTGQWRGMCRYEKGDAIMGEAQGGTWEKQWSAGLIIWALLSDDPLLWMAVDQSYQMMLQSNPATVWQGYWGARIAAHYLDELMSYWLLTRDPALLAKAQAFITKCENLLGPGGYWPNLGNQGLAEESPWMQVQLVAAIFRWYEQAPGLEAATGFTRSELCQVGGTIMSLGSTWVNGQQVLLYRFGTTTVAPASMHNSAFALPMLRYMAAYDPIWQPLYWQWHGLISNWGGSNFAHFASGQPAALSAIGYRYPTEGLGWSKSMMFYLEAFR
ncbi:MAG: hypothetical protein H6807_01325 [Planctomycetes bacterium]|nr:hypothetical protein [Planctomycetota bacterium]